jgi:flagellar motility protein MotE (MotC chaperone)
MAPQDAATVVFRESPAAAASMLLTPSPESAARILDHCNSHGYAGELIAMIAATHPQRAGRILENIAPERAGTILSRMDRQAVARTLGAMRPGDAAVRLREAEAMRAGVALGDMPAGSAGYIVDAMDDRTALRVLSRTHPQQCAAILARIPGGRGSLLASRFQNAGFRRSVQEFLDDQRR